MSEETATVTKPVDEAIVVHDPVVDEEKMHDELVAGVTKLLEPEGETPEPDTKPDSATADKSEKPAKAEETAKDGEGEKGSPKGDEAETLSQELQTRVKGAGLSEDLVQKLHQSGQLEETLAAFDRSMIDYVQSKESKGEPKEPPKAEAKEPPSEGKDQEVPALDPEVYDEDLVKRDAYQQQRIDALESQIQGLIDQQQGGFDEWMDGALTELGIDTSDDDKCQSIWKAYGAVCDAFGKDFNARDKEMVKRAYAAMYPQEVFKQKQQQTVDRLRDASGKFLSTSKSQGGPPPKGATNEEVQEKLVSDVSAYLKEQGVQMSGV